jgi:Uma2 family endonuclease
MVTRPPPHPPTALWPPDDTEESIVGVDRHQHDITSLRIGLIEEAHRRAAGGPLPWQPISQILLLGGQRPDGSRYDVMPDIMVFPRPMDDTRGSYSLRADGPPVLVVEVASESTYRADLDTQLGKGWTYAHADVAEYLVLDPSGQFVPELGRGWRLVGGLYQPWVVDERGRWVSQQVGGVAIGIEDGLAAVYGANGRRQLREGEVGAALHAERLDGRAEGRREGRRAMLRELARQRFGVVAALEARIDVADEADLDAMIGRLFTATDPAEL